MKALAPRRVRLPRKFDFLFKPSRYKVAYGGRGGAKSQSFAKALLIKGAERPHRILCTREFQSSIKNSVHRLLKDQIRILGLESHYRVTQTEITGANGTEFIFAGLKHNSESIRSTASITIAWVEEADRVSQESWQVLIPTVRDPGSEIWVSFNPQAESDPTYQRFIKKQPPDATVVFVNWQDNPWFPDELRREKDYLYSIDPEAAEHVWGGKTRVVDDSKVLRGRWRIDFVEPEDFDHSYNGPYYGADWGYAADPTALICCWVREHDIEINNELQTVKSLYIGHEAYGLGVELDDIPELFDKVPGARFNIIRADNARPETISHVRGRGYSYIEGVDKWPGSVEAGVTYLRNFYQIIIDPTCRHTIEEAGLWSFKRDRLTGEVLPTLIDKHNHCWDSVRYALSPLIRRGDSSDEVDIDPDAGYSPRDTA